jgi:hypothetical protein
MIPVSASVSKYSEWALRRNPGAVGWAVHQYWNVPGPIPRHGAVALACRAACQIW